MTKAPFGGAVTGANPTDRGKRGTKRSTLCERHGLPIAIVVAGANVPDIKLAAPTLDALVVARPEPTAAQPQHLCLDAGYDYDMHRYAAEQRRYVAHMRPQWGSFHERGVALDIDSNMIILLFHAEKSRSRGAPPSGG